MSVEQNSSQNIAQITNSVLVEKTKMGHLNQSFIQNSQPQILALLNSLVKKYTQGDSTSVRVEVAERILISIHYVMDNYLSSLPSYNDQISYLQTNGVNGLYEQGLEYIKGQIVEVKSLFSELSANMLEVPSEIYSDTFKKEIPAFLRKYNFHFNAHDTMCSLDYPLIFDDMSLQGITYIKNYLTILKIETIFCNLFPIEDLNDLLIDFGRKHRIDIINAPINLFELTFNNALFSFLSEENNLKLMVTKSQFDKVNELICNLPQTEVSQFITSTVDQLLNLLEITHPPLIKYINQYTEELLIPRILNGITNKTLFNIPVVKENVHERIVFEKAQMMDDETFRSVIDELLECENSEEKLDIISNKIHSTEDFIDILSADCLFGDEARDVFKILDEIELAVIAIIVFSDDFSSASFNLEYSIIAKKILECETPWQQEFLQFLNASDEGLLKVIDNLIKKMGLSNL
ncbi:MAG: hypothetical protein CVV02_05230 [Firmicutes bacterium HGW-Firmicutes-7]|nr:MAG: hypothetical protein CVV02_05230 [Firmicutes bacterium HGW-Firmicutes-7]